MLAFIMHNLDCTQIAERIEVSHPAMLADAPDGFAWTNVPTPVGEWSVALDDNGGPQAVPFVRPADIELSIAKAAFGERIKDKRNAVERAGCATPYGRIDTDADSQRKIGGASTMALALGTQFTMSWRMADNSIVTLNASQMIEVGVAAAQYVAACQANKNALDAAVQAATSVADLDAIDIEAGWPG
jgi:hypothetical protein